MAKRIDVPKSGRRAGGIRRRVMMYLMGFVAAMIGLLWLFQIVLLDDFYRWNKTRELHQVADTIAANSDHSELQTLIEHLGSRRDVCILLMDEYGTILADSGDDRNCLVHRMSAVDRTFWCSMAPEDGSVLTELFSMTPVMELPINAPGFRGPLPAAGGNPQSMLCVRRITRNGEEVFLLVNSVITPVDATVDTLRTQLIMVTAVVLLGAALLGWRISRRVVRPIIETNEAARSLAQGQYTPPAHGGEYREMAELNQTLVTAAHELGQVEHLQHELIANISHDLRTPLTMIGGYAEVMRDLPGEAGPENMQIIIDETARLTSLVSELLDFSRLQTGSIHMNPAPFDLTELVASIVQRVSRMTGADGYVLRFEAGEAVTVLADKQRIAQVLYNLVGNALTYTGEDKTVTVTQTILEDHIRIDVRDTGKGIPPEELPLIWKRYYRSQENHRRAVIGSGLGLSIVQSILEKHGARYGVDSTVGEGTTFWFECARCAAPEEQAE